MAHTASPLERLLGKRVRAKTDWADIPKGTTGLVEQYYRIEGDHEVVTVAWDLSYRLRDGLSAKEALEILEVIE